MSEISRKFNWVNEAEEYIREAFRGIGMGHAYYGRIVVKDRLIGFDKDLNMVREYNNRFGTLYITKATYNAIVTSEKPELSTEL